MTSSTFSKSSQTRELRAAASKVLQTAAVLQPAAASKVLQAAASKALQAAAASKVLQPAAASRALRAGAEEGGGPQCQQSLAQLRPANAGLEVLF